MLLPNQKFSGIMIFAAAVECLVGISVSEELYPGYSVSTNFISDLGATCSKTSCTIVEPSSIIFNSSVFLLGVLVIAGAVLLYRSTRRTILASFIVLAGVGAAGVGVFPETTGIVHGIVSLIVFLFAGLSAVASYQVTEIPMNYLSVVLGIITLVALALFLTGNDAGLGPGGMERMIAYPALLWQAGFGAQLMKT